MPSLTVITVVRNDPDGLRVTARSLAEQDFREFEWVVVDGGSASETQRVLEEIRSSCAVQISEPDDGIYDAMNKGVRQATGDWSIFLNAGDLLHDAGTLGYLADLGSRSGDVDLLYGDYIECFADGQRRYRSARPLSGILVGMPTSHQAMVYRTRMVLDAPFEQGSLAETGGCEDWSHLLDRVQAGMRGRRFDRPVAVFDATGVSSRLWRTGQRHRVHRLKQLGLFSFRLRVRYLFIHLHAVLAHTLARLLPRRAWMVLAGAKRMLAGSPSKSTED